DELADVPQQREPLGREQAGGEERLGVLRRGHQQPQQRSQAVQDRQQHGDIDDGAGGPVGTTPDGAGPASSDGSGGTGPSGGAAQGGGGRPRAPPSVRRGRGEDRREQTRSSTRAGGAASPWWLRVNAARQRSMLGVSRVRTAGRA